MSIADGLARDGVCFEGAQKPTITTDINRNMFINTSRNIGTIIRNIIIIIFLAVAELPQ